MKQVICIESTEPIDKPVLSPNSAIIGCIYTPTFRGPIVNYLRSMGYRMMLSPGTPDDYYMFLEIPNVFHNARCFVELEDDEETEKQENAKVKEDPAFINTGNK